MRAGRASLVSWTCRHQSSVPTCPAQRSNLLQSSTCCKCPGLAGSCRQLSCPSFGARQLLSWASGKGGRSGEPACPSILLAGSPSVRGSSQADPQGTVPSGTATQHLLLLSTSRLWTGAAVPAHGRGPWAVLQSPLGLRQGLWSCSQQCCRSALEKALS